MCPDPSEARSIWPNAREAERGEIMIRRNEAASKFAEFGKTNYEAGRN
jgi:hypothetical protein